MPQPRLGRTMAKLDGEFVVFLIGARILEPWAIHKWLPVALAMPRMMRELQQHPELGFLGHEAFGGRTTLMVQYWRSLDALMDYARAKDSEHLPAWKHYNEKVRRSNAVGIWHETYVVRPGNYENIYVNMPPFGLAKVAQSHGAWSDVTKGRDRAQERLDAAAA